ncbi:MAG: choice-of-anchor B family protein [Bacteroidetes bacterium]|nr:choice-of-anchor B family protein [Bacteroidota bacterium]
MSKFYTILLALFFCSSLFAQQLCENGLAGGIYPCNNVDLLAHMNVQAVGGGNEMNDIWGWTDSNSGREFVLLGKLNGTAFIEITDPSNPVYLGDLPTHTLNSIWRDIKVYQNHAYIVSEAGGHGMQVFDLNQLLSVTNPPTSFTETAHYGGFGNAHNIVINESEAIAYAVGTNTFSGGLHIVDISNPNAPVILGDYATDGYTHDAQVVTYNGPDATYQGRQIAFNCNEDAVTIADVEDPTDTQTISVTGYAGSAYAHQGWLTDDHRYFLQNDELDESNNGTNTRTFIWDVQDLNAPVLLGFYQSAIAAIDHNLYNDKNLCYQSNYRGGLRILDIQDVANANLSEVAFFDVYPASNSAQFNGAWSAYPYFASGVVPVSHIEEGLFLLKPQFLRASAAESLVCFEDDYIINISIENGFVGPVNLSVSGLPPGATSSFSANNVGSGNYTLTLSNLPQSGGVFDLEIEGVGANFTYKTNLSFTVFDCVNDVLGCTDPAASNFNPNATVDDGSCVFPCYDFTLELLTDNYPGETTWTVTDDAGAVVASGGPYAGTQTAFTETFCLNQGCYTFDIFDSYGDGMQFNGVIGSYELLDANGNTLAVIVSGGNFGFSATHTFCAEPDVILGCTNSSACNFNPAATSDDGSCLLPDGCTDINACNYNANALCDDGSCILPDGCTNPLACNFDANATCDDGSCLVPDGCTNPVACNYDVNALCDDASCILPDGCTDNTACNYDMSATCDDGSCVFGVCCPGDYNNDGLRNASDLLVILGDYGCFTGCSGDVNGDNVVNAGDVLFFLTIFGVPCD